MEQRWRFVETMSVAADDAGLPDDPEFRSALLAYLEWGTRPALANSQPGAAVVPQAPGSPLGLGRGPAVAYQSSEPGAPLNGPATSPVTQPP